MRLAASALALVAAIACYDSHAPAGTDGGAPLVRGKVRCGSGECDVAAGNECTACATGSPRQVCNSLGLELDCARGVPLRVQCDGPEDCARSERCVFDRDLNEYRCRDSASCRDSCDERCLPLCDEREDCPSCAPSCVPPRFDGMQVYALSHCE